MPFSLRRLRDSGVLGMNRRNAAYSLRCNPRSGYPLVDDKVLTKELARKHGIPAPSLYAVIERQHDISRLEQYLGEHSEFVVKPARGAGGAGIVLITGRRPEGFVRASGDLIPREDLAHHISNILSGIFSLGGLPDRAILESLIHPAPVFADVSYRGVPDIRIVAYCGVPVMGMVRLPTRTSDGKANLHRGAIGAGIDIRSGRTITAVHGSRIIAHHPDTRNPVSGIEVPEWKRMLLIAARGLEITGLGYLGVDLVIDRDRGPLLLEMNARPGLAIQLANRAGLLQRLERVDASGDLKSLGAEERVAWAAEAFSASP